MLRNTESHYGNVTKFLHWLVFVLITALILVGFFWENAGASKFTFISLHKIVGIFTLAVVLLRIYWTLINRKPQLPAAGRFEKIAVHGAHVLIYFTSLAMPLSGWLMSTAAGHAPQLWNLSLPMPGVPLNKALASSAGQLHLILAWTLIALVSLHIIAALKHHFIDRNVVLKRMLPGNWN